MTCPCGPVVKTLRPSITVEHGALSGWGLNFSPGASTYQRIILNNSYMMNREIIPAGKKWVSFVSSTKIADLIKIPIGG